MRFDFPGYDLYFIQQDGCKDNTAHLFTRIYKFFSPETKYFYIVRAEFHEEEVFAIKFYCKKDKRSEYKYSKIVNKGDLGNILITCLKVVPLLLQNYPNASFGFIGSRTVDIHSGRVESYVNTQRFRVYKNIVAQKIGNSTFQHIEYPDISGYLLLNRNTINMPRKKDAITKMFATTYSNLLDV